MKLWKEGELCELVSEGHTIQGYLLHHPTVKSEAQYYCYDNGYSYTYHTAKIYTGLDTRPLYISISQSSPIFIKPLLRLLLPPLYIQSFVVLARPEEII